MSVKTITIKVCDKCGKEIVGRLITHSCPLCHRDVCVACQEAEDAKTARKTEATSPVLPDKPARKREKKVEDAIVAAADNIHDGKTIAWEYKPGDTIVHNGEHLIIHVPTGEGDDTRYKVMILNSKAEGDTLNGTVCQALIPWKGEIPETLLTETETKTLKGILEAEK